MPEPRLLKRAPIREAVVDIKVPTPETPDFEALKRFADSLEGYPTVQVGMALSGHVVVGPDGKVEQDHKTQRTGFRAVSKDGLQVVQIRPNGVSLSRLEPYLSWAHLEEEAQGVFSRYRAILGCPEILRMGLRYINNLRLPYPVTNLDNWVRGLPQLPKEWPQSVSSFLYRQALHDQVSGYSVNVMHALADDVDESKIGVIFDIDAHCGDKVSGEDDRFWGTFDKLRDLKNRVFFAGVTDLTLELFE